MKTTPTCRKAVKYRRIVFSIFSIALFFCSNYSYSQQLIPIKDAVIVLTNPSVDTPTYLDTTDVYVCKGDILEITPLALGLDTNLHYEYIWKRSVNELQPVSKVDSGNKKIADMVSTVNTKQQQANTFFANIDIGDIVEGRFKRYYFKVIKIHLIAKPVAPTVNSLLEQHIGDVVNLQANSPYANTSAIEYYGTPKQTQAHLFFQDLHLR